MIDIAQIGEKTLSENFQKLYVFFQNIWKQPHSYIVLTSGRCFNLHELFLEYHNSQAEDPADTSSIISENALPLYVQNMVEEYIESGHFPSILIVDDLVFHGRSITEIIRGLEAQIHSILMEHDPNISCDEIYDMHRSLVGAVDIMIFAVNRYSLLLDYSWKMKVQTENLLYTSQLRQLSRQLTGFMVEAEIPMTDCILSCRLNSMPPIGHTETWVYENRREKVFFTDSEYAEDASLCETNFLSTVRCRTNSILSMEKKCRGSGKGIEGKRGEMVKELDTLANEVINF